MILESLSFVVFLILSFAKAEYSSVLLWDSSSPIRPTLEKISPSDFSNYISSDVLDSMLMVFIDRDEHLEFKDFSSCKLNTGDKCFTELARMKNKVFYPNVEDPIEVLRDSNLKKEYVQINENNELDTPVEFEKGKITFITFTDPIDNGNKAGDLHKRDSIIRKIYEELSANGKTVGMYTKEYNNLKRVIRQAGQGEKQNDTGNGVAFNINNKFLIYFKELSKKEEEKKDKEPIHITSAIMNNETSFGYNIELSGGNHKIKLHINMNSGYWYVKDIDFDNKKLQVDPPINAAEKFSYYCGNEEMSDNDHKITLYWSQLQMEPIFNQTTDKINFSDPWHCTGFTSTGIWSGLFVTFMMLAILSIGITWLMDIRTMDRFDDPKGKTITVNASE